MRVWNVRLDELALRKWLRDGWRAAPSMGEKIPCEYDSSGAGSTRGDACMEAALPCDVICVRDAQSRPNGSRWKYSSIRLFGTLRARFTARTLTRDPREIGNKNKLLSNKSLLV
jgi:hypothetical protein